MNMVLCKCTPDSLFAELGISTCFGNSMLFIHVGLWGVLGNRHVCSFLFFISSFRHEKLWVGENTTVKFLFKKSVLCCTLLKEENYIRHQFVF